MKNRQIHKRSNKYKLVFKYTKPPGLLIDINALIELGVGLLTPADWVKLYSQTGNIIFTDANQTNNG